MLKKKLLIVLTVIALLLSSIVYSASAITVQQLFPGYNVVNGTVINEVYLRGAPCAHTTANPVYFYKINGNNICIASGKSVYVLEKDNGYYYIVYHNPNDGKYYTGYVPIADISCSGASWCDYDVYWTAEAATTYSSVILGPGAQSYFSVISVIHKNLPKDSIDVTVLKTVGNFYFIQYRLNGELVRGWTLKAAVTVYGTGGNSNIDYFSFVSQYKTCNYSQRDSSEYSVYIINKSENLALTVNNTASGTVVTAEEFTGDPKQEFAIIRPDNEVTVCKIYSQHAKKMIELTDIIENGALGNVKAVSDPNKRQEFIFRKTYSSTESNEENCIISTRGSGGHSALKLNSSDQLIATDCDNSAAFEWNIKPKIWGGSIYYGNYNNNKLTLGFSVDPIPAGYGIDTALINRAIQYWNDSQFNNKVFLDPDSDETNFVIKFVTAAQAPSTYSRAYGYTISYDASNTITTLNTWGANNYDWWKTELYIVLENFRDIKVGEYENRDDKVKVLAHEFGHSLKFPHTAVNNEIESIMNDKGFSKYPDFRDTNSNFTVAKHDRDRMSSKTYY